jgi:predicted transposase/invertase (TIGR01784 family)
MNTDANTPAKEELSGVTLDIRYDNVFKAVFTDEAEPKSRGALSGLLSAITGKGMAVERILQNEPATGFALEKQIRYDINCTLDDGTRCNVEMMLHPVSCEALRMEYYTCRAYMGQASKSKKFSELVPVYQVSVLNGSVFADKEYLHVFRFYDADRHTPFGGHIGIFTVELPKVGDIAAGREAKDMTPAERWAVYFLYNADESAAARKLVKGIMEEEEGIRMAAEVLHGFTEDEKIYYRLLSEQKYEMDHYNLMADAEERGIQSGIQIGEERAEKKARAERDALLNALRASGVSDEIIRDVYRNIGS